jgi:hypothetical protein
MKEKSTYYGCLRIKHHCDQRLTEGPIQLDSTFGQTPTNRFSRIVIRKRSTNVHGLPFEWSSDTRVHLNWGWMLSTKRSRWSAIFEVPNAIQPVAPSGLQMRTQS